MRWQTIGKRLAESFIGRSYAYGIVSPFYHGMRSNGRLTRLLEISPMLRLMFQACAKVKQKSPQAFACGLVCRRQLIFPGRLQPSIVSTCELNYRVRNGNGWTLTVINTYYSLSSTLKTEREVTHSSERTL